MKKVKNNFFSENNFYSNIYNIENYNYYKQLLFELNMLNKNINIITHYGNCHRDDYFALAIFIYNIIKIAKKFKLRNILKNIRIIRINEEKIKNYENDKNFNIFIDIGKEYFFPLKFDHHHDINLNSSLILVISAFYNIEDIYNDFKKYSDLIAIDYIDRFGIEKYINFIKEKLNIGDANNRLIIDYMLMLNSSFNNFHLKLLSKYKYINRKHYLFKYLYNIGKLIDLKIKLLISNAHFNIDIINLNGLKAIINFDNRITPLLIQKFELLFDYEYDYDIIITKSLRDMNLLSIYINPYKNLYSKDVIEKLNLDNNLIKFIHNSNKILSIDKYQFLIKYQKIRI